MIRPSPILELCLKTNVTETRCDTDGLCALHNLLKTDIVLCSNLKFGAGPSPGSPVNKLRPFDLRSKLLHAQPIFWLPSTWNLNLGRHHAMYRLKSHSNCERGVIHVVKHYAINSWNQQRVDLWQLLQLWVNISFFVLLWIGQIETVIVFW